MKYKKETFVAYYKLNQGLVSEILIRPVITVPITGVVKGLSTPTDDSETISTMITDLINIVDENDLSPIVTINSAEIAQSLSDTIYQGLIDTDGNDKTAGITIKLAVADSGVNSGNGVLIIKYRFNGATTIMERVLEVV